MEYPILVVRYDADHPADLAICEGCEREAHFDPAEGDPYDRCVLCEACGGQIFYKYHEGDTCRNCGGLGYDTAEIRGCCSRRCLLQWEYAQALKATL